MAAILPHPARIRHNAAVSDDEVFESISALVAAGEYRDEILGRPGMNIQGGGAFRGNGPTMKRIYRRGSPEHLHAREQGWTEPLPPLTPAPPEAVDEAESLAGAPLPPLLRRLYLEIGNGGCLNRNAPRTLSVEGKLTACDR